MLQLRNEGNVLWPFPDDSSTGRSRLIVSQKKARQVTTLQSDDVLRSYLKRAKLSR